MTSIVFPGQGSQYQGMAKDFYDNFEIAKKVFLSLIKKFPESINSFILLSEILI